MILGWEIFIVANGGVLDTTKTMSLLKRKFFSNNIAYTYQNRNLNQINKHKFFLNFVPFLIKLSSVCFSQKVSNFFSRIHSLG
jgi:hypothetical protein